MVNNDEAALYESLKGTRLKKAPQGFQAALLGLFGLDDVRSFALVDGDDGVVLGIRRSGLLVVSSKQE